MSRYFFTYALIFFPIAIWGQIGPVHIIDSTFASAGVTKFQSADLDNDGDNEIITSFTGTLGRIAYYENHTADSFSSINIIDSLTFSKGIAIGDFNGDNWNDIVAIGGIGMEARIYINHLGSFPTIQNLDSNISIQVNDVVVADFDGNNSDDIVIIGQHSIDLYRNNGTGSFSKEIILSTSTSPFSLECLDLSAVDIDGDNDIDLVCGETEGLVIYFNNGNGQFSPQYYSIIPEILFLIHPMDMDGDGDVDVVAKNNIGDLKWFSNNGNGTMTYEATFTTIPTIISLNSIDFNNDGLSDLYVSYQNNISIFENDINQSFSTEVNVFNDNSLLMGQVQIADIDHLGAMDFVWAGGNNTVAYQINQTTLSIESNEVIQSFLFYPNPTQGIVHFDNVVEKVDVFDVNGMVVYEGRNVKQLDLSSLHSGIYFLTLKKGQFLEFKKIVKN